MSGHNGTSTKLTIYILMVCHVISCLADVLDLPLVKRFPVTPAGYLKKFCSICICIKVTCILHVLISQRGLLVFQSHETCFV